MNLKNMAADRLALLKKRVFQTIFHNVDWDNTKKSTHTAVKAFKEYLTGRNTSANSENLSAAEFDKKLSTFYCRMRNRNKDMYGKGIFISYRYSVQHYLETAGKKFESFTGEIWNASTAS